MNLMVPWTMTYRTPTGYKASRVQAPSSLRGMSDVQIADVVGLPDVVEVISMIRGDHMSTAVIPAKYEDNEEIIIG